MLFRELEDPLEGGGVEARSGADGVERLEEAGVFAGLQDGRHGHVAVDWPSVAATSQHVDGLLRHVEFGRGEGTGDELGAVVGQAAVVVSRLEGAGHVCQGLLAVVTGDADRGGPSDDHCAKADVGRVGDGGAALLAACIEHGGLVSWWLLVRWIVCLWLVGCVRLWGLVERAGS